MKVETRLIDERFVSVMGECDSEVIGVPSIFKLIRKTMGCTKGPVQGHPLLVSQSSQVPHKVPIPQQYRQLVTAHSSEPVQHDMRPQRSA